jgi:UDP-glucuronate 4-epimerase
LKAFEWARTNPGSHEVINLGESRTITLSEMIRIIAEEMGKDPVIRRLPMQPGDVSRTYADVAKARRLFGYDPRVEFRDGVRMFVEWLEAELRHLPVGS